MDLKEELRIEPKIGYLKQDHRLSRNFYKGIKGDTINVMLAAAGMNFKRMINKWKSNPLFLLSYIFETVFTLNKRRQNPHFNFQSLKLSF